MTNGGFAEYIAVPEKNVFKIPNDIKWELAASLPVTTITPYRALNEAALKVNESLLIFGAFRKYRYDGCSSKERKWEQKLLQFLRMSG
jgi:hypothetical protein